MLRCGNNFSIKHKKSLQTIRLQGFTYCAQDETRTHTRLPPLPPQSSVYTNFTTWASFRGLNLFDLPSFFEVQI